VLAAAKGRRVARQGAAQGAAPGHEVLPGLLQKIAAFHGCVLPARQSGRKASLVAFIKC